MNILEKGGEVPGSLHQLSFLKHPSCCWLGCGPSVKVESTSPFLRAWISCFTLFYAKFPSKAPVRQRQNHKSTMLCWILRHPICPRVLECLAEGQRFSGENRGGNPHREVWWYVASAHIDALPAVKLMPVGFQPGNTGWKYSLSFSAHCSRQGASSELGNAVPVPAE